jgi:hypothetical protein
MANWAYSTWSVATGSGDSWSQGDVIHAGDVGTFIKWDAVLENSGCLPAFPLGQGLGVVTEVTRLGGFVGGEHPVSGSGMYAVSETGTVTFDTTTPGVTRVQTATSAQIVLTVPTGSIPDYDMSTWHATLLVAEGHTTDAVALRYMNAQAWVPNGQSTWGRAYVAWNTSQTFLRRGSCNENTLTNSESDIAWIRMQNDIEDKGPKSWWLCAGTGGVGNVVIVPIDQYTPEARGLTWQRPNFSSSRGGNWTEADPTQSLSQPIQSFAHTTNSTLRIPGSIVFGTTSYTCDSSFRGFGIYRLKMTGIRGRFGLGNFS